MAEEGAAGEGVGLDLFREVDLGFGVELISDGPECVGLGGECGDERGVCVSEDGPAETREEVDVLFTVGVPEE